MRSASIIPAYNEQETLGGVLEVLQRVPAVDEIIVVSDGSTDRTAEVARSRGVRLVELPENRGKGAAMRAGLEATGAGAVLFLDADLIGLTTGHVQALLEPVLAGACQMTVGIFAGGRLATDLAHRVTPFLSGQRAIQSALLAGLPGLGATGYGAEWALTRYCHRLRVATQKVPLPGLTHRTKEEKLGLSRGLSARLRMYREIARCSRRAW